MAKNETIKVSGGVLVKMRNIKPAKIEDDAETPGKDSREPVTSVVVTEVDVPEPEKLEGATVVIPEITRDGRRVPDAVRAVLSPEELKIYSTEVGEWLDQHPDWDSKEDLADVHGIAMERVIQYRLMSKQKRRPYLDIEKNYDTSVDRVQKFRTNLAARRVDRITSKRQSVHQTNIAIIAGQLDDKRMNQIKSMNNKDEEEEANLFPDK